MGRGDRVKGRALSAVSAQAAQAIVSFALQIVVARLLGIDQLGRFAILYGIIIVATAVITGLVGDSLVVLDRADRAVRAGLQSLLIAAAGCLAIGAALVVAITGFGTAAESVLLGLALATFGTEEIIRRLLMAHLRYERVILADLSGFVVVLVVVATAELSGVLSLAVVLGALSAGQAMGCLVGWRLVPSVDRRLVGFRGAAWRKVLAYGAWRALQQVLRPSLYTVVRLLVLTVAGVSAVGLLEAARTYTSPLTLMVGGLSSFLFVRYADQRKSGATGTLRDADRAVAGLVGVSIVLSVVAFALAPLVTPLLFGVEVDRVAVVAWLVYGLSVAVATPYGALGAVAGQQASVFLIRLGDTVLAVIAAGSMLLLGAPSSSIPLGLAVASALGGLCLRRLVAGRASPSTGKGTTQ